MEPENFIEDLTNFKLNIDEDGLAVGQNSDQPQSLNILSWSKKISKNTDVNEKFVDSGCQAFNELGLWVTPAILEEEEQEEEG